MLAAWMIKRRSSSFGQKLTHHGVWLRLEYCTNFAKELAVEAMVDAIAAPSIPK
jgi:hypothetical protein